MYLKRKIDDFLIKWKEDINRKPLIVKGARQIGKTESIMHFANANYTSVIYINFALDKRFIKIAEDGYDVNTIVKNISLINPSFKFVQGNTIIVFDEIQEYPDIATALKSFRIDGRYDIICSGSMLGIITGKFTVTVLEIRLIMKCFQWISRNFCGLRDMTTLRFTVF